LLPRPPPADSQQLASQWDAVVHDFRAGRPTIGCMHADETPNTTERFRLVTGDDAAKDEGISQEPVEKNGADRHMD
jgi:hypothetical protein